MLILVIRFTKQSVVLTGREGLDQMFVFHFGKVQVVKVGKWAAKTLVVISPLLVVVCTWCHCYGKKECMSAKLAFKNPNEIDTHCA